MFFQTVMVVYVNLFQPKHKLHKALIILHIFNQKKRKEKKRIKILDEKLL